MQSDSACQARMSRLQIDNTVVPAPDHHLEHSRRYHLAHVEFA
jgi:hypothetical protein